MLWSPPKKQGAIKLWNGAWCNPVSHAINMGCVAIQWVICGNTFSNLKQEQLDNETAKTKKAPLQEEPNSLLNSYYHSHKLFEKCRKFFNKCAGHVGNEISLKRTFSAFRGFLQNENRTIFGWDVAKNVIFLSRAPQKSEGAPLLGGALLLENLRYPSQSARNSPDSLDMSGQFLKMSAKGVWSRWTKCPTRVN